MNKSYFIQFTLKAILVIIMWLLCSFTVIHCFNIHRADIEEEYSYKYVLTDGLLEYVVTDMDGEYYDNIIDNLTTLVNNNILSYIEYTDILAVILYKLQQDILWEDINLDDIIDSVDI